MTAQPAGRLGRSDADRVPRTIDGIAEALRGPDRMEFYREVGQAEAGADLQHVVASWWARAMLASDPEGPELRRAVAAGSLPTVTMVEMIERRRAAGGELPDGV
jgi:hypothetical protein